MGNTTTNPEVHNVQMQDWRREKYEWYISRTDEYPLLEGTTPEKIEQSRQRVIKANTRMVTELLQSDIWNKYRDRVKRMQLPDRLSLWSEEQTKSRIESIKALIQEILTGDDNSKRVFEPIIQEYYQQLEAFSKDENNFQRRATITPHQLYNIIGQINPHTWYKIQSQEKISPEIYEIFSVYNRHGDASVITSQPLEVAREIHAYIITDPDVLARILFINYLVRQLVPYTYLQHGALQSYHGDIYGIYWHELGYSDCITLYNLIHWTSFDKPNLWRSPMSCPVSVALTYSNHQTPCIWT